MVKYWMGFAFATFIYYVHIAIILQIELIRKQIIRIHKLHTARPAFKLVVSKYVMSTAPVLKVLNSGL